jgi:hypothetical protein
MTILPLFIYVSLSCAYTSSGPPCESRAPPPAKSGGSISLARPRDHGALSPARRRRRAAASRRRGSARPLQRRWPPGGGHGDAGGGASEREGPPADIERRRGGGRLVGPTQGKMVISLVILTLLGQNTDGMAHR